MTRAAGQIAGTAPGEPRQANSAAARAALSEIVAGSRSTGPGGDRSVLVGLIGRSIQSSLSPTMHEREGERLGLRYAYTLIDFDRLAMPDGALDDMVAAAEQLGFAGLNITHPFKQSIVACLTDLAPEAAAIGAVNTVIFKDGARVGYNTDSWGFAESFREHMAGCGLARVQQFGAGGAGAAVAHALMELGVADLALFDIDPDRAARLGDALTARFERPVHLVTDVEAALATATGIVNTTPVGMAKYPGMPFKPDWLSPRHWVAEIVYFPAETELLRRARALGCRTLSGAGMAVLQAVRAFELFTGAAPNRHAMTEHFRASATNMEAN